MKHKNVYEHLKLHGDDQEFEPTRKPKPTRVAPGSDDKVMLLRRRVELGEELWHDQDNNQSDASSRVVFKN